MIDKLVMHEGEYIYIRFKALVWQTNCLIKHSTILQSSMKALKEVYMTVETDKVLVVSLKGIVDLGDRTLENFFSETVYVSKRPIIFIHHESFSDNIIQAILRVDSTKRPKYEYDPGETDALKISCSANDDIVVKNLLKKIDIAEKKFLTKAILGCHKKVKQRLLSTVVSANVEFDAAKIISEPHLFIWICLFMADKVSEFVDQLFKAGATTNSTNIRLLSVSLRSSPFASAVSFLINKRYDTIDHLGPKHKLFDIELFENFEKGIEYIYIGDFVVGGTEIKIAQAYAELLGCKLNHAVVLSSYLDPIVFKDNFTLITLTKINDIVQDAEYNLKDHKA